MIKMEFKAVCEGFQDKVESAGTKEQRLREEKQYGVQGEPQAFQ